MTHIKPWIRHDIPEDWEWPKKGRANTRLWTKRTTSLVANVEHTQTKKKEKRNEQKDILAENVLAIFLSMLCSAIKHVVQPYAETCIGAPFFRRPQSASFLSRWTLTSLFTLSFSLRKDAVHHRNPSLNVDENGDKRSRLGNVHIQSIALYTLNERKSLSLIIKPKRVCVGGGV